MTDKKHILLVEDEAVTSMDIRSGLVQLGYDVLAIASTGEEATCKAAELSPDLILMDITLAGPMNGIAAATEIRKSHAIPIIFLTAHTDAEAIESAKKTQPFGYLTKPVNIQNLAISIDVAIYKSNADAQIRESEERYRDLVELAMSVVLRWDTHGTVTFINEYGSALFGYPKEEIIGRNLVGTIVAEKDGSGRNLKAMIEEIAAVPKKYLNNENENRTRDNRRLWMHWRNAAVLDDTGKIREILSIGNDITERKQAEKTLDAYRSRLEDMVGERTADLETTIVNLNAEIEERKRAEDALERNSALLRGVFEGIQDGIAVLDVDHNIVMVNRAVETLLRKGKPVGYRTIKCFELFRQDRSSCGNCTADRAINEKSIQVETVSFRTDDGTGARWVEIYTFPFYDAQGKAKGVIKYLRDISERKRSEEDIRESELRYRTLFDKAGEGIIQLSGNGDVLAVNESFARMHGYSIEEIRNMNVKELEMRFDPEVHAERIRRIMAGETLLFDVEHRHKAGHAITLHVSVSTMKLNGEQIYLCFHRDITEKIRLEERGRRFDHLASLGQISAGIAHEINNPNHIIMSNAELLQDVWQDAESALSDLYTKQGDFPLGGLPFSKMQEKVAPMISRIVNSTVRINSIVNGMKQYTSHIRDGYAERVVINDVMRSCLEMLHDQIAGSTDVFHIALDENVPCVQGNRHALEQVIFHLVSNALQALTDRTKGVTVATRHDRQNKAVILQVMDEGRGMAPDVLRQATSPFYTTRQESGGRGLGLSISLANVKNHNGSLDIESSPGLGTVATVRLPVEQ